MKCTEFDDRLNEVLDLRLSPTSDRALVSHAEGCADCRELLCAQDALFAGLAQFRSAANAPDLGRRVLAELQPSSSGTVELASPPAKRRQSNWLMILSSAAVVLMAVSFGLWIAGRNAERNEAHNSAPTRRAQSGGLAIAKPGVQRIQPKRMEVPKIAPPEAIVVTPKRLEAPSPALPNVDQAITTIAARWPQAGQWPQVETLNVQQVEHYAPSFRPIRESFEVALDALLKTLPGKKDSTRPTQPQALQPYELLHIA